MREKHNKSLKSILIVAIIVLLIAGIGVAIYFALQNREMRYYNIKLTSSSGTLTFSGERLSLAPNSKILNRSVTVNVSNDSGEAFIRAKIIFESNSEDNRVLSFVNQLNYAVKDTLTYSNSDYSWSYYEADNSFYLMSGNNLKNVTGAELDYYFLEDQFLVPSNIDQITSLNSDGNNVQVSEDVVLKIIFEAVQTVDILGNDAPIIENVSEHFNNLAIYSENDFTSENGYITSYTGTSENLILPKYVGEDYIIGIKQNAFNSSNLKRVIIPGNYIYFDNNCFTNCPNLNYVAIKSETPIKLSSTSFIANTALEIYLPNESLNYVKNNFGTLPYINNIKSYTTVSTSKISEIDKNVSVVYAPNVTEFEGNFKNHNKLKLIIAPNLSKVNDEMFNDISTLIECDTPNVVTVGNNSFSGCTSLISANFSKKLESIGTRSFYGCNKLLNINFAQNLTNIPQEAFRNCASLTKIKLLNDAVEIGQASFANCTNLRMLEIQNLGKIESGALSNNSKLKFVKINSVASSELEINENFIDSSTNAIFVFNNANLKNNFINNFSLLQNRTMLLKVNNGVLEKFDSTERTVDLTEFNLINKITEIGNEAFKGNESLQELIIPSSVKKLGSNFVADCLNLTKIRINSSLVPEFTDTTFNSVSESLTIYVPNNTLNIYQKTLEDINVTILAM